MLFFQGLEATLNDPKKKYPDKVNALLSAWEHVTAFIATSAHEASETLIDWVHRCVCHTIPFFFFFSVGPLFRNLQCLLSILQNCGATYMFPL